MAHENCDKTLYFMKNIFVDFQYEISNPLLQCSFVLQSINIDTWVTMFTVIFCSGHIVMKSRQN